MRQADEAFCVGPGPVRAFLSQHSEHHLDRADHRLRRGSSGLRISWPKTRASREICADHGLTFIGPKPSVIAQMGDKATAKRVMKEAGVATTPGTDILASVDEARAAAEADRLSGAAQSDGGRRRQRHARRRATPRNSTRAFARRDGGSRSELQRRPRVHGKTDRSSRATSKCKCSATISATSCTSASATARCRSRRTRKSIEEAPAPNLPRKARERSARDGVARLQGRGLHATPERSSFWSAATRCTSWR